MYNHEQGAPGDWAEDRPHERYADHLVSHAAEYGMTPEALHALNEECVRDQSNWAAYEDEEPPEDWTEDQADVLACVYTSTTHHEPADKVYEAYGTADDPNPTMSLEHDAGPDINALPLEHEHEHLPPDWEYPTAAEPEHDGEAGTPAFAHTARYAVEPHCDDTEPLEPGNSTLWDELWAVDEGWAADHEGGPDLYEGADVGMYSYTTYSPPPPPTSWNPPQPPTTSYAPPSHPYPASFLFPHYRPD